MKQDYNVCKRCVMDNTIPRVTFDRNGICSECTKFDVNNRNSPNYDGRGIAKLEKIIATIRNKGNGKKYDCIVGLSGGVDSSYVLYLVCKYGLRPLVVHMDNGWNSEVSELNIKKIVERLEVNMHTFKLNWDEFKDLQLSFLYSSTPHCEHPTDHAILSVIYKLAAENDIEYIISGSNISTEGIAVSTGSIGQRDWKYIKSIHDKFGSKKLREYPHFSMIDMFYYKVVKKQKTINILNYIDYNKDKVMKFLKEEFDWEYYGGKHYESVYTRFFQAYILPRKFNIDKRKAHFSSLIVSGQIDRDTAILELEKDPYPKELLENDKKLFLNKLELTNEEFDIIMNLPVKKFEDYPSYEKSYLIKLLRKIYLIVKPIFKF